MLRVPKMLNRKIINLDCICSYHWKTCLFYVIEKNNNIWKKEQLCTAIYCSNVEMD